MSDREVRRLALVASVTEALEVARLGWPDEGRVLAELLTWRNGNRTTIQVHERWRRDRDRGPMMAPRIPVWGGVLRRGGEASAFAVTPVTPA